MLATYHRAPDGIVLLVETPWVLAELRRAPRRVAVWVMVTAFSALCCGLDFDVVQRWLQELPSNSLAAFVLMRQASIAAMVLLISLLSAIHKVPLIGFRVRRRSYAD